MTKVQKRLAEIQAENFESHGWHSDPATGGGAVSALHRRIIYDDCPTLAPEVQTPEDAKELAFRWLFSVDWDDPNRLSWFAQGARARHSNAIRDDLYNVVTLNAQERALLAQIKAVREKRAEAVHQATWRMKNL